MNPLVSIVIPTFNRASIIKETLQSVISQEYQNWECIIVDDGSTDNTATVISSFLDLRIKLYQRPAAKKKGASSCRNYGLEMSKGELIQFLDDDDLLDKNKIVAQVKAYSGGNELLTCKWGGFTDRFDLKSRFKYRYHSYRNFRKGIHLLNSLGLYDEFFPLFVYLIPRKLFIDTGGEWNEELTNNDDAEFFTRIILKASEIVFVPDAKVYYRYHSPNNLSSLNSEKKIESAIKSWKLIEGHIKEDNFRNSLKYVKRAKANLFDHLKTKQPQMLLKYTEFFSDRNNYDSNYYKYLKKLKQLF